MSHIFLGALVVLVAGHLFVGWSVTRLFRDLVGTLADLKDVSDRAPEVTREDLLRLAEEVERLPSRWEEIHAEADRIFRRARSAEERARHVVNRTQKELQGGGLADDTLDALAEELRNDHVTGGGGEGLHAVHSGVESDPPVETSAEYARRIKMRGR